MMEAVTILANTYCSKELTQGLDNQIICLSVINPLFAITAFVGNAVILIALHKETLLHQPSKALIRNLVASDVCVSFVELVFVAYWISILQERWQTCRILYYAQVIGAIISLYVSLCTLAAISVDRLPALLLGLRYRQIVTLRRVYAVNATIMGFSRCLKCYILDFQSRYMESLVINLLNTVFDNIPVLLHQNFR